MFLSNKKSTMSGRFLLNEMWLLDKLIGKPLASFESEGQKIGVWTGLPILGLDGLSSAAYGPEAALAILLPLSSMGLDYIGPIILTILAVLTIVYFSYRQTISAYPNGGGSYTVASENLGNNAGLLAAAALMLDYVLNVAVGISAGIGALVSAVPSFLPYTLPLRLVALATITMINLRGVRDTGVAFAAPTYLFIVTLLLAIGIGIFKVIVSGGHPEPIVAPPALPAPTMGMAGLWLLLRAFASGCTAMTGVEAVSNAVGAFATPTIQNAKCTLTAIVAILVCYWEVWPIWYMAITSARWMKRKPDIRLFFHSWLRLSRAGAFSITLLWAVLSLCWPFRLIQVLLIFPRLARLLAEDKYFPHTFALRGRRLDYTIGILFLAFVAGLLLIVFHGITDALIPLFAVGAFMAFTLSQAGMVVHWHRESGKQALASLIINGAGAVATGAAVVIMLVAKFTEGAWITVLLIPALVLLLKFIKGHYDYVVRKTESPLAINLSQMDQPIAVMPIDKWSIQNENGLRFALRISSDVIAVHVMIDEEKCADLQKSWDQYVIRPVDQAHMHEPKLVILSSPYRLFQRPFLEYVLKLEQENPERIIAVVVPELVQSRWHQYLLHNHRAAGLKEFLLRAGDRRIVVINVPWYLGA